MGGPNNGPYFCMNSFVLIFKEIITVLVHHFATQASEKKRSHSKTEYILKDRLSMVLMFQ